MKHWRILSSYNLKASTPNEEGVDLEKCTNHHTEAAIAGQLEDPLSQPHSVVSVAQGTCTILAQNKRSPIGAPKVSR